MTKLTTMQQLHLGIDAARKGQVDVARDHLQAIIIQEPENIPALLWLAFIATDPQQSIDLLVKVLALDPNHERAQSGLRWAQARLAAQQQPETNSDQQTTTKDNDSSETDGTETEELPNLRQQLLADASHKKGGRKSMLAHRARRTINPFLVFLLTIAGITGLIYFNTGWLPLALADNNSQLHREKVEIANIPFDELSTQTDEVETSSTLAEIDLTSPQTVESSTSTQIVQPQLRPNIGESQTSINRKTILSSMLVDKRNPLPLFEPVDEMMLAHQPDYPDQKWIEVNLKTQEVTAWEGNIPVMQFIASTGITDTPTVVGKFNIYWKLESAIMTGVDYYLPEVPYTMYFHQDYGIHGTYWHDNFGQPMSHGCVNLHTDDAQQLFEWAGPTIPPQQTEITSSWYNPGTLVVIHE